MTGNPPVTFRAGRGPSEQPLAARELAGHPALILPGVVFAADCSEFQPSIDASYLKWSQAIIVRAAYGDAHDDHAWYGGARRQFLHDNGARYLGRMDARKARRRVTVTGPGADLMRAGRRGLCYRALAGGCRL